LGARLDSLLVMGHVAFGSCVDDARIARRI